MGRAGGRDSSGLLGKAELEKFLATGGRKQKKDKIWIKSDDLEKYLIGFLTSGWHYLIMHCSIASSALEYSLKEERVLILSFLFIDWKIA